MATIREIEKRWEKKGWKFKSVHSSATAHLRKSPVIATKGSRTVRGTSFTDVFAQLSR
jgi:hypothetical protein